jgi:hypothetical protein
MDINKGLRPVMQKSMHRRLHITDFEKMSKNRFFPYGSAIELMTPEPVFLNI